MIVDNICAYVMIILLQTTCLHPRADCLILMTLWLLFPMMRSHRSQRSLHLLLRATQICYHMTTTFSRLRCLILEITYRLLMVF
ncbi:hypothetical protein Hanom_Chr11g01014561 [Helianthus anomalus]